MGVGMPASLRLDAFGARVFDAFGHHPYLVGSALASKTGWRDVDVRLILPDDEFDVLFSDHQRVVHHLDMKWVLLCDALSELGKLMTGLPVDFQIQRQTEANAEFDGSRSALGLRITE